MAGQKRRASKKQKHFGARLKARRERLKLKQSDVALAIGVSERTIHRLESGTTKSLKAKHIAPLLVLLEVPMSFFLEGRAA